MKTIILPQKTLSFLLCLIMALSMLPGGLVANTVATECAHVHTQECLSCEKTEHTHTDECREAQLICEQEEHAHTQECYQSVLSCADDEHTHSEECYDAQGNLICETAEHTHSEGCYTQELICEKTEHTHAEECYEKALICTQDEHTHTEECYQNCRHICGEECGTAGNPQDENPAENVQSSIMLHISALEGTANDNDGNANPEENSSPNAAMGVAGTVVLSNAPVITNYPDLPNGKEGELYTGPTPTYTGTTPITWSATGLPGGLTIDPDTGIISGTPVDGSATINQSITIVAGNGIDPDSTIDRTITIDAAAPLITLTKGTDGNGTIGEWMLRGDADRDGTVYYSSDLVKLNELRQTTLNKLMLEVCDINHNDTVNSNDVSALDACFKSTLPNGSLDFRVVDYPNPYYAINSVTVNGNELSVPDDFNATADTTIGGVTYTVEVNRHGKVTVSGPSLAENDVQFTHKEVGIEYFMGAITSAPNTVVYDGLPHTIGQVFLYRRGERLTDPADMLYYLHRVADWYVTKNTSTAVVDTSTGTGWPDEVATSANVLEFMQKTLDYFSDFNAEAFEYSDVGNYYFKCDDYQMTGDPTIPRVAHDHFATGVTLKVLSVTRRPITITADDASKLADGTPLEQQTFTIGGEYGLVQGHSIGVVTMDASITNPGTTPNTISDAVILDADGNDVTANYDITYENGTLEVKSAPTPVKSDPPTEKIVTGNPGTAASFTFVLSANDNANPMPEGSANGIKEITRTGAGSVEFGDITFTQTGTYVYTITEKNTGVANYTYDTTSYTATYVVVDNNTNLEVVRTIVANGKTVDKATFTNAYTAPAPVSTVVPGQSSAPQTGDYSNLTLWVSLLCLSCCGLLIVAALSKKRRRIHR